MGPLEKDELEKRGTRRKESKSISVVFRYADWVDLVLMFLGTVGAIGDGMSTNCLLVFVSRVMNSLGYGKTQQNHGDFMDEVEKVGIPLSLYIYLSIYLWVSYYVFLGFLPQCSLYFVYLAVAVLVVAFMGNF